ncbi:uncharacterized protein [Henckelia pumila]|uniref:uncharacterized protein n=1 Tax=Henckelia pumila TaxID=405737 RepID=UPI003C6E4C07
MKLFLIIPLLLPPSPHIALPLSSTDIQHTFLQYRGPPFRIPYFWNAAPAQEPQIVPETTFGGTNSSFVGGERVEPLLHKGNIGVAEVDRSKSNNIREIHSFKFVLIEHIRQILKPFWEQGNLSKDAYKIVIKKSIDKIIASIQPSKFPRSKNDHHRYISASRSKIFELVQAYVKKNQKEASILKSVYLALLLEHQDPLGTFWNHDFSCCKISSVNLSLGSQLYHKMFGLYVEAKNCFNDFQNCHFGNSDTRYKWVFLLILNLIPANGHVSFVSQ